MPSLQNIEAFKKTLRALGREPEITAERGEKLYDIKPPEGLSQDDLSDLLFFTPGDEEDASTVGRTPPEEAPLSDPEKILNEPGNADGEGLSDEGPSSGDDLLDFLNPEDSSSVPDFDSLDFSAPSPGRPDDAPDLDGFENPDAPAGTVSGDDFAVPEDLFGDGGSAESAGTLEDFSFPEDLSFEGQGGGPPESGSSGGFEPEEPADLDEPEDAEELPPEEPESGEPGEVEPLEAFQDDFSLPDEPPSPEELFSTDFTSSFGEDRTGDLFDTPPSRSDESVPDDEPDTTAEIDGFDLSSFGDFSGTDTEEPGGDSDEFSFHDPQESTSAAQPVPEKETGGPGPDDGIDNLGADEFSIDEFNLGDIGRAYGIEQTEVPSSFPPINEQLDLPDSVDEHILPAASGEDEDRELHLQLSDKDFLDLQRTMALLPRNLKLVIEELIGEDKVHGENLERLVRMLVHGESPKNIAQLAGRITGKRIQIPKGYEKRSFKELEEEQKSFAYALRTTILPIVRVFLLSAAAVGLLAFFGYRFVYRPVSAQILYSRGYGRLSSGDFKAADVDFGRAVKLQPMKGWFFRYAEGYAGKKQFIAAEETYDRLLSQFGRDEKGILDYAALESGKLANYEKAEKLLNILLDMDIYHYRALLASGDNYLTWAEEDASKYEEARRAYAILIERNGGKDELLFRMLRYFIRTDKAEEVMRLEKFFQSDPGKKIDPDAYAELGGYLVAVNELDEAKDVLMRARGQNHLLPELHYNLARLFRKTKQPEEERKALLNARDLFEGDPGLTRRKLSMLIDTHVRLGESEYAATEYLTAEQSYRKAIGLYEDALSRKLFQPSADFGRMYADLADIFYYVSGELPRAGDLYLKARDHGFSNPELSYKVGYVEYSTENFDEALKEFQSASSGYFDNRNLMFATANALFSREDYFAAQGYFEHLLSLLERDKENLPQVDLRKNPERRAMLGFLMKTYNNLGVTLLKLGRRTGNPEKASRSLVYFTYSSDLYDELSRDPDTLVRTSTKNLAFLNTHAAVYPAAGYEPQIYPEIPRDHTDASF